MRRTSTWAWWRCPRVCVALGGQPPAQLRDDAVHGGEVRERAGGQRAVEVAQRPRGRQGAGALRSGARSSSRRSSASKRRSARAGQAVAARVLLGELRLGLGAQAERAADALHVDADHARARRRGAERGDRQPREVAHRASSPSRSAAAICRAQRVELPRELFRSSSPPSPSRSLSRASRTPSRTAASSTARKKKRSNTSSNTRRSSGSWRASRRAPRGSPPGRSTRSRAAPRTRRAAPRCRPPRPRRAAPRRSASRRAGEARRAAGRGGRSGRRPAARRGALRPRRRGLGASSFTPDALGDHVQVGAVLDDHAHRLLEGLGVDVAARRAAAAPAPSRSTRRCSAAS